MRNVILTFGLASLFQTSICSAETVHWNDLKKTAKPSNEGVHARLNASYVYLSFNGSSTCIPKTSLLNLPESLSSRITDKPQFKVIPWNKFLNANFAWIRSYPVKWEQVTGKQALTDEALKGFSESPSLMIATYTKSPVSVLPPKDAHKVATNTQ